MNSAHAQEINGYARKTESHGAVVCMCVCVCVSGFVAVWIRREMPKRTRNTRKNEPSAPSGVSQERMAAIAGGMERDSVESLLEDFDVQSECGLAWGAFTPSLCLPLQPPL